MADLKVRVVDLEPMRVARFSAIGEAPERDAWEKLRAWAAPKGLLDTPEKHPIFGFNNPPPSRERREYGYEFWIRIDPLKDSEDAIEVQEFAGGLYAVTRCKLLGDPAGSVVDVWKSLWDWAQTSSEYRWRRTHELEQSYNLEAGEEEIVLDLYLPIEARSSARA